MIDLEGLGGWGVAGGDVGAEGEVWREGAKIGDAGGGVCGRNKRRQGAR